MQAVLLYFHPICKVLLMIFFLLSGNIHIFFALAKLTNSTELSYFAKSLNILKLKKHSLIVLLY